MSVESSDSCQDLSPVTPDPNGSCEINKQPPPIPSFYQYTESIDYNSELASPHHEWLLQQLNLEKQGHEDYELNYATLASLHHLHIHHTKLATIEPELTQYVIDATKTLGDDNKIQELILDTDHNINLDFLPPNIDELLSQYAHLCKSLNCDTADPAVVLAAIIDQEKNNEYIPAGDINLPSTETMRTLNESLTYHQLYQAKTASQIQDMQQLLHECHSTYSQTASIISDTNSEVSHIAQKKQEYSRRNAAALAQLNTNGYNDKITHESIVDMNSKLLDLDKNMNVAKSKLSKLDILPPDVYASRAVIRSIWNEVEKIESQIAQRFEQINSLDM